MKNQDQHLNDISVGRKIRLRREMLKMSQKKLGNLLGVTFQQIQKYEKATNRIGAGRLQQIADILDVDISFFYTDISKKENFSSPYEEGISSKEEYFLLKGFRQLNSKKQKAILWLIAE
ncbi:helix-turn-helix domain-containing protein [Bartonella queenslandensis]|uniref:helix-turn-helix domain-containing protein n=1 Tax=Bartonella queenslandensis TaxID=481138 RepID=UPI0002FF9FF3|nr:helix-turn-helix transcriptional regulator [Bartonella queenslandensis]